MSAFTSCAPPPLVAPDPAKRVNYTHGLVLGVDELVQDVTYLSARDESIARDLIGYGTVAGLRVEPAMGPARGPALLVGSGMAVTPSGRLIRLPAAHAVHVNEWLEAQRGAFIPFLRTGTESPPRDILPLSIVLAYRECATDAIPAPGGPCRTDEPASVFTRIADGFRLDLRYERPGQREEDALREFVGWLRLVETTDAAGTLTLDGFLAALRASASAASPPGSGLASPPHPVRIPASLACDYMRAAFRVWTTELRPLSRTTGPAGTGERDLDDDGVLLADVDLPLTTGADGRWVVDESARIAIGEERRPYLLQARLLQEWVLCRDRAGALASSVAAAGIVRGDATNTTHRRPLLNGLRVTAVSDGNVTISFDGYAQPAPQGPFQFVVKALSQARGAAPGTPVIVNVGAFEAGGIRLLVSDVAGNAIPAAALATIEIAIEISRYAS
jgi:hypothetical protein